MAGNDAFQKFKSSLNRGVTTISVKTSSSLEKMKLKTHIDSLTSEVDRLTAAVGEAAYHTWDSGEKDYASLEEQFEAIRQKKAEIEQLNAEYLAIDERDKQIFGSAQAAEAAPPPAAGVVCPNCGAVYQSAVRFCRKCGAKLQE